MFGYVRPFPGELKVSQYEQFKAAYCGLCHTLRKRYGFFAQFLLAYDYTFLLLLISNDAKTEHRRCMAKLFRKKHVCTENEDSEYAADITILLTYRKFIDNKTDNAALKSIQARVLMLIFGGAYKKAQKRLPEFDKLIAEKLRELSELENIKTASLDMPADKFALILAAAADKVTEIPKRRILRQILYHTGRWIYIIDAFDDLKKDFETGDYNALRERFELKSAECSPEIKKEIEMTLKNSLDLAASAYELMERGVWTPVIENIIYQGMPYVTERVLRNDWKVKRRRQHE